MKQISIQDLKSNLSSVISDAESGQTILITRHNEPVAKLSPAFPLYLHRGKQAGTGRIVPALKRGLKIPYMETLADDRGDR